MSYHQALDKAWEDLAAASISRDGPAAIVRLFGDTYSVDAGNRAVLSESCNVPAKDYAAIIILHYLARQRRLGALPAVAGHWIDFKELDGGEAYYPTFKKRTIDRIVAKFGARPADLAVSAARLGAKKADIGDTGVIIPALDNVPILIALYAADDDFGADATVLYDRDIAAIFCTEDTIVLTEMAVHLL